MSDVLDSFGRIFENFAEAATEVYVANNVSASPYVHDQLDIGVEGTGEPIKGQSVNGWLAANWLLLLVGLFLLVFVVMLVKWASS